MTSRRYCKELDSLEIWNQRLYSRECQQVIAPRLPVEKLQVWCKNFSEMFTGLRPSIHSLKRRTWAKLWRTHSWCISTGRQWSVRPTSRHSAGQLCIEQGVVLQGLKHNQHNHFHGTTWYNWFLCRQSFPNGGIMFAKEHFTFLVIACDGCICWLVPGTRIPTTSSLLSTCWRKSDFSFDSRILVPPMAVEQKPMRQQEIRPYPHTWQSRGRGWPSKPRDPRWTSLWNRGSAILWAGARLSCFKERPKTLNEINAT